MIDEYSHKPLMWDTMARRELEGLPEPSSGDTPMETDAEPRSLRDRISGCNEVYQTAVKRIKTDEMWSLYIDCMMEINHDSTSLPNYKRKLLKNALVQAHQGKKLREKYYLHWVGSRSRFLPIELQLHLLLMFFLIFSDRDAEQRQKRRPIAETLVRDYVLGDRFRAV